MKSRRCLVSGRENRHVKIWRLASPVVVSICCFMIGCGGAKMAAPTLTSIKISPLGPTVAVGATVQFTATGAYSDGSTSDLTKSVEWYTDPMQAESGNTVATISSTGLATGVAAGSTYVTVTSTDPASIGIGETTSLTVTGTR